MESIPREIDSAQVNTITSYEQQEFRENTAVLTKSNPFFFTLQNNNRADEGSGGGVMHLSAGRKSICPFKILSMQTKNFIHCNIANDREASMF